MDIQLPILSLQQEESIKEIKSRFPDYIEETPPVSVAKGFYAKLIENGNIQPESRPNDNNSDPVDLAIKLARVHFKLRELVDKEKKTRDLQGHIKKLESQQTSWRIEGFLCGVALTVLVAVGAWGWSRR